MIVIIDYGMGNLGSLVNMLRMVKVDVTVSSERKDILSADHLVLPGVGSFDRGMQSLKQRGLIEVLEEKVLDEKAPVLGICLGMQLLTRSSEEGTEKGLSWIDAETRRFRLPPGSPIKIPHMGWDAVTVKKSSPLFRDMDPEAMYYFVHSFHVVSKSPDDILCTTRYGYEFPSGISHANILGVQFHPEKSHRFGMSLMKQFAAIPPSGADA